MKNTEKYCMYIKSLLLINKDRRRFEIRYIPYILRNFTHVNPNFYLSTFRVEYFRLNFVVLITFQYNSDTKFITKMGRTLLPKFPRDQDERLWRFIRVLILGSDDPDIEDPLMIRPPLAANSNGEIVCNDEVSISPTFYTELLCAKIPKA